MTAEEWQHTLAVSAEYMHLLAEKGSADELIDIGRRIVQTVDLVQCMSMRYAPALGTLGTLDRCQLHGGHDGACSWGSGNALTSRLARESLQIAPPSRR